MLSLFVLLLMGVVVGCLSGLLGIGGGIIIVPMLTFILPVIGVSKFVAIKLALGSSLACASFTLLASSLAHKRNGNLNKELFKQLLPGIVIGAIIGPMIVSFLPGAVLKVIIGVLLFALAVNMALEYEIPSTRKLTNIYFINGSALTIGIVASFAGLSGAVLLVPYFVWFGVNMRQSVGTAAMCGLPLAVVGMISYMIVGYNSNYLPGGAIGYVYWPAVFIISIASMPTAQIAARMSNNIPKEILKRLLAIVLTLVASKMLFF